MGTTQCKSGHLYRPESWWEDKKGCPYCKANEEARKEAAKWARCDIHGQKFLKTATCALCKMERNQAMMNEERRQFQTQIKEMKEQFVQSTEEAAERHRKDLAAIGEKDRELREQREREYNEKMRQEKAKRAFMEWKMEIQNCKMIGLACNQITELLNESLSKLAEEIQCHYTWSSINVHDKSIVRLVLFSPTGHGKSTLANRILGDESEEGDGILETSYMPEACTSEIVHRLTEWNRKEDQADVCVIDTPGWNESESADRMHANNLISYLRGAQFVHGICLIKHMGTRFTQSDGLMVHKLETLIGADFWQHVILVITHVEGKRGRSAHPDKFKKWKDKLLGRLDRNFQISDKLRRTARPQSRGVTAGNRQSIRDIPVIGLSSFDESGGPFDYRVGISNMIHESRKMGVWTFRSMVSPYDQMVAQFHQSRAVLANREASMKAVLKRIRQIESEFKRHPESLTACVESFQSPYKFMADEFASRFERMKADAKAQAEKQQGTTEGVTHDGEGEDEEEDEDENEDEKGPE